MLHTFLQCKFYKWDPTVVANVMSQVSLNSALKRWGAEARISAEKEVKQLHWHNSFRPTRWKDLIEKEKKMVLESHIFITHERSGELKARKVAGGNKQRGTLRKKMQVPPL